MVKYTKLYSVIFWNVIIIIVSYASLKIYATVPLIPKSVLFGNAQKAYPVLSPDGKKLAYCAPFEGVMNIWIRTVGLHDDIVLTHDKKRGIFQFSWAADNKHILYLGDYNGDENYQVFAVDSNTKEVKNHILLPGIKARNIVIDKDCPDEILLEINKENSKYFDVYHLDLTKGTLNVVAKNPGTFSHWIVGHQLQVLGALRTNNDGSQDILVRETHDDEWKVLVSVSFEDTLVDEVSSGLLGFNKDNSVLYLNTSLGANTRCLQAVSVRTGERRVLAQDLEYDVNFVTFDSDRYEPEVVCFKKERNYFQLLNFGFQDDFKHICSLSSGDLAALRKTKDGKKILLGFIFDNKSTEYYMYDCQTKKSEFLFYQRPELNKYDLALMEPISFQARDGLNIQGYLTCPIKMNKKSLPLVLLVHGGPFSRDNWEYNSTVQLIANRGCACLQVNYRGSNGYGKAFLAAGNGEWGGKMQDDLVDAVQWAVDKGIADPKKIAIFGGSYGGYAALVGATQTPNLFCCAISLCGPSNLITLLETLPPYWLLAQWEKYIGKLSNKDFLKSRSPVFHSNRIKIPILIAHGAHDVRVKQSESEQIVQAMKEKGIDYEYILFSDEGHGLIRPINRLKFYTHVEQFLSKHLGSRLE